MYGNLCNQRGSSLIGALFVILAMGLAGTGVMQLSASETGASTDQIQSTQAFYAGQAAIERVKHQLEWGYNPVGQMALSDSTTTITTDPYQRLATVVAQNDDAQVTQTINTDFSRDAIQFDTSAALAVDDTITGTRAIKSKLRSVTLTAMRVEWNQDPCVLGDTYTPEHDLSWCGQDDGGAQVHGITMAGTQVYGPSIGGPSGGAESGEHIDIMDYAFVPNQTYSFDMEFDHTVPPGTLVTVAFIFMDGSELETTYQVFGPCELQYFARNNGRLEVNANHQIEFEVISRERTYGSGGNALDVRMFLGTMLPNGGYTPATLFGGNYVMGGETDSVTSSSNQTYILKAHGTRGRNFSRAYDSTNTLQVKTLLNGDQGPQLAGHSGNSGKPLSQFFDANNVAVLEPNQVLVLFELSQTLKPNQNTASHYQDVAILMTVNSTEVACQH